MELFFSSYVVLVQYASQKKIVGLIRLILRFKNPVFNPWKWDEYYSSKKSLDISSNHIANMIGVKIPWSCYLFLVAKLNSLRYYFIDDNESWVSLVNPWIWKFQNRVKYPIFGDIRKSIVWNVLYIKILVVVDCWMCLYLYFHTYMFSSISVILLFHSHFFLGRG